jgi:peptide deformylase
LINPVILEMSQYQILREGCMSVPDFTANVKRAKKIRFQSLNLEGKVECRTVRGFQAVAVQHEIDHLNGMLFLDRVACLNTDVFRRKRYL